jgi:endo-1,4-beta-D-glucanase Y
MASWKGHYTLVDIRLPVLVSWQCRRCTNKKYKGVQGHVINWNNQTDGDLQSAHV